MQAIYQIKNIITNIVYVGSAVNIDKRWKRHVWELNNQSHSNIYLKRAWNKYGAENFKFEILEIIEDINKLIEREQFWLDWTKAANRKFGYNFRLDATSNAGLKFSEEHKRKISIAHIGKVVKEETKEKLRKLKLSEERKIAISKFHTGRKASAATKALMSIRGKGRKHSAETRAKMSEAQKGKVPTESQRKAVSEANKKRIGMKYNKGSETWIMLG